MQFNMSINTTIITYIIDVAHVILYLAIDLDVKVIIIMIIIIIIHIFV